MAMTEQIENYIKSHIDPEPDNLYRLYRRVNTSLLYSRMCSGHLQGRLLKMLTAMINPMRVLEIGTYAGYSALCIAEGLRSDDARVDTIEIEEEMEDFIREQLNASPVGHRVNLHIGDAMQIIPALNADWDLVYIDANKRVYCDYYNLLIDHLRPNTFIIADNTLWDEKILDTETNNDPQTLGIARFNDLVAADPRVETVIIPLRDGLTLLRKI
ncbi:MAG: O-methyltransferase [Muribaculaceae bacterium]|nr:O-methyltransferase [Muribaculaceae bacterium]